MFASDGCTDRDGYIGEIGRDVSCHLLLAGRLRSAACLTISIQPYCPSPASAAEKDFNGVRRLLVLYDATAAAAASRVSFDVCVFPRRRRRRIVVVIMIVIWQQQQLAARQAR